MKQVVIGDIHGHDTWKQIVSDNGDADRFVFIGDYVDSFSVPAVEQLQNLIDICNFKRSTLKEVILLIGNHDFHYLEGVTDRCSGYQASMRPSFQQLFYDNKDLFQMCFIDENDYAYTHAGITETWLSNNLIEGIDIRTIGNSINEVFETKRSPFYFSERDGGRYGDHVSQSPIWVRPNSLYRDGISNLQIVGHTTQNKINPLKSERQGYYLIDTLGTSGEYLFIDNGTIKIKSIKK